MGVGTEKTISMRPMLIRSPPFRERLTGSLWDERGGWLCRGESTGVSVMSNYSRIMNCTTWNRVGLEEQAAVREASLSLCTCYSPKEVAIRQ